MRYHYEKVEANTIEEYLSFIQLGYVDIVIDETKKKDLFLALEKKYTSSDAFMIEYAKDLLWGFGCKREEEKGRLILKSLITNLHPYALTILGAFLMEKKEYQQAETYLFSALQFEFALSGYFYGKMLENGWNGHKDVKKAETYYLMAAKENVSKAQYALGKMYQKAQEFTSAYFWFSMASKQKEKDATYELANAYFYGYGTKKDEEKALKCYQEAFEQGYLDAAKNIGAYLFYHPELDTNGEMAIAWLFQIKDKEDAEVHYMLGFLLEKQNRLKEALEFYLLSAKENHVEGALKIGQFYEEGNETTTNLEQAIFWYEKAALLGNEEAKISLRRAKKALKEETENKQVILKEESPKETKVDYLSLAIQKENENDIIDAHHFYELAINEGNLEAKKKREEMQKRLKKEKRCPHCGSKLKGFLFKYCPTCKKGR